MPQKPLPSADILKELLAYDPASGDLTWRHREPKHYEATHNHSPDALAAQFNTKYAGRPALACVDNVGYPSGRLFNSQVRAHRVIWKMVYGYEPELIDHINRDKADNRLCNLRAANKRINMINRDASTANTSGRVGVGWDKSRSRWVAQINTSGLHRQKRFATFEEAVAQREEWERELFGDQPSARDLEEDFTASPPPSRK